MVVVDTHCHASPYWFEPIEVLLDEMTRNEVDKAASSTLTKSVNGGWEMRRGSLAWWARYPQYVLPG